MSNHTLVAPVGDDNDTIFQVIRSFPTDRIILIADNSNILKADELKRSLEKFMIPISISKVNEYSMDEIFKAIRTLTAERSEDEKDKIIINVASGNKITSCLTLCAAYVYGITAVAVMNSKVMLLPIVKLSYYKTISEKKMRILKSIGRKDCCPSLEGLSKDMNLSVQLVSYHINGSKESDGLKKMGLVETKEQGKKMEVHLTMLGEMLLSGYF